MSPRDDLTQPEVLDAAVTFGRATLELRVPAALGYFRGHFPSQPILPGVIQLAWAASLGQKHLQAGTALERLEAVKFSRIVRPEAHLSLTLEWSQLQRSLTFIYTQSGLPCSSGRFIFAA